MLANPATKLSVLGGTLALAGCGRSSNTLHKQTGDHADPGYEEIAFLLSGKVAICQEKPSLIQTRQISN